MYCPIGGHKKARWIEAELKEAQAPPFCLQSACQVKSYGWTLKGIA